MRNSYFGDIDGDGVLDGADCSPLEGGILASPAEVSGLLVGKVASSGEATLSWVSQDTLAGEATCYDIATGLASELKADNGYAQVTCLADDVSDVPYSDARLPALGESFYYLLRAQNGCGTGTWGDANVAPDPRDALDGLLDPCP
jgi:hypothetical protein